MSNTSTVTPYADQNSSNGLGTAAAVCAGAVAGTAAVAVAGVAAGAYGIYKLGRWLASEPPLSPEQLAEIREVEQEYQEKMVAMNAPDVATLHLQDPSTLLNTAKNLGYQEIQVPEISRLEEAAPILLESNDGTRLAITRNEQGRVEIHTAAGRDILHTVVGRHTQERVLSHLTDKGMKPQITRLDRGEIKILAHESNTGQSGGAATIDTRVHKDGSARIEIDRCRDRRCEDIVQQITVAVGGVVTDTTDKNGARFQLPGEPTKTRVKT